MSYYRGYHHYSGWGGLQLTPVVKNLLLINGAVFLLTNIFGRPWIRFFGLVPQLVFSRFYIWQLVTYMFVHLGFTHLLFNMLMLFFFGPALEQTWGRKFFLTFYFFTGIGAGLCSLLTSLGSMTPVIGASGALFGILVAYAMMFPDTVLLLFFVFPMKIRYAVFVFAGLNLMGALSNPGSGIAYMAHLGGGLFGYLYLKYQWIRLTLNSLSLAVLRQKWQEYRQRWEQAERENLEKEVNRILDKVSQHGMNSLSAREKEILKHRSRR